MTHKEFDNIYNEVMNTMIYYSTQSSAFVDFLHKPSEDAWMAAESELHQALAGEDEYVGFHSGATKAVIVSDDNDYVIKMPFLWVKNSRDWNCEKCEYDTITWDALPDYCKIEWRNYALAHAEGLDKCFAATYYIGEYEGCPIYIQDKYDCNEDEVSSQMYDSAWKNYCEMEGITGEEEDLDEIQEEFSDNFYDGDCEYQVEDLTYAMWGSTIAAKFWDFCSTHDINDLHTGNWSCWDDTLIAVDYSGYGDNSECAFQNDEWCRNVLAA